MPISVGSKAPDFKLITKRGDSFDEVRLSDNFGKTNTVLLFFPAAFAPPCTQEMCDATGGLSAFKDLNATVFGISGDNAFSQEAWAKANNIEITLLSDYTKEVAKSYDVLLPDLLGMGPAVARAVVVIDSEGVVRYAKQTPTPLDLPSLDEVKEALRGLTAGV